MTNTLVPHEIAVELHKAGYPFMNSIYGRTVTNIGVMKSVQYVDIPATDELPANIELPDIYQAAAWLRSKGVHISVQPDYDWEAEIRNVWHCVVWEIHENLNPQPDIVRDYAGAIIAFPDHDTSYIAGIANAVKLVK